VVVARSSPKFGLPGWAILLGLMLLSRGGGKRRPANVAWTDDDMRAFKKAVEPSGVPLEAALAVYAAESGLDAAASSGAAWGIAQITAQTLRGLGYPHDGPTFGTLSVAEQAPWIGRLLKSQVAYLGYTPQNAVDLYAVNFWPKAAKLREDVIVVRDSKDAREAAAYRGNAGLDAKKKGWITRDDLRLRLEKFDKLPALVRAREQLRRLAA